MAHAYQPRSPEEKAAYREHLKRILPTILGEKERAHLANLQRMSLALLDSISIGFWNNSQSTDFRTALVILLEENVKNDYEKIVDILDYIRAILADPKKTPSNSDLIEAAKKIKAAYEAELFYLNTLLTPVQKPIYFPGTELKEDDIKHAEERTTSNDAKTIDCKETPGYVTKAVTRFVDCNPVLVTTSAVSRQHNLSHLTKPITRLTKNHLERTGANPLSQFAGTITSTVRRKKSAAGTRDYKEEVLKKFEFMCDMEQFPNHPVLMEGDVDFWKLKNDEKTSTRSLIRGSLCTINATVTDTARKQVIATLEQLVTRDLNDFIAVAAGINWPASKTVAVYLAEIIKRRAYELLLENFIKKTRDLRDAIMGDKLALVQNGHYADMQGEVIKIRKIVNFNLENLYNLVSIMRNALGEESTQKIINYLQLTPHLEEPRTLVAPSSPPPLTRSHTVVDGTDQACVSSKRSRSATMPIAALPLPEAQAAAEEESTQADIDYSQSASYPDEELIQIFTDYLQSAPSTDKESIQTVINYLQSPLDTEEAKALVAYSATTMPETKVAANDENAKLVPIIQELNRLDQNVRAATKPDNKQAFRAADKALMSYVRQLEDQLSPADFATCLRQSDANQHPALSRFVRLDPSSPLTQTGRNSKEEEVVAIVTQQSQQVSLVL